ncbi:MAG: deoxyhypusine synthase [Candidatus Woesearchaeota archaeon]
MKDPVEQYRNRPQARNDLANHPTITGFSLDEDLSAEQLLKSMSSLGFQASKLSEALETIKAMRRENATIFFGCTSNMISSGLRELIRYLVEHKYVDALVTSAGGIEEDIIKCFGPFKLGSFRVPGKVLREEAIHRIGNIWVPTDRYTDLDKFLSKTFEEVFSEQEKIGVSQLLKLVGERLDHDESILTWAARNDIPVLCPAVHDGAFGDILYFRTHQNKNITLDIAWENKILFDLANNAEKTGAIILGGGVSKHFILNANILRDGLDYLVNINTAQEFDGSDSGGHLEEAITWSKLQEKSMRVKVHCEATIAFPLLAAAWMSWERSR